MVSSSLRVDFILFLPTVDCDDVKEKYGSDLRHIASDALRRWKESQSQFGATKDAVFNVTKDFVVNASVLEKLISLAASLTDISLTTSPIFRDDEF